MKATIDRNGYLCLQAENETELYALKMWWNPKNHESGERGIIVELEGLANEDEFVTKFEEEPTE